MKPPESVVIVGAGQAGLQTAEALRSMDYSGPVTLLGDESHPPYHRPPLSKAWLAGEMGAAQLMMRSPEALARKDIVLRTGARVTSIDRGARVLHLADANQLPYGALVLATGASPRPLSLELPPDRKAIVLELRSMGDALAIAQRMRFCLEHNLPIVVAGGGFIGLEVAATARKMGLSVTLLEAAPRLLGRALAPVMSQWYAELHRSHGVQLVLEARIDAIRADSRSDLCRVETLDGAAYPAGLVVVGVGVEANDGLARTAGVACDRGIVVDGCGRTSDPCIFAAGDCTARRLDDGTLLRLESVQNALEQGKSAAAAVLGLTCPFNSTPWFWSDQYDVKLQIAGLSTGADHWEIHGDLDRGSFSVHHLKNGRLIAVDNVNASREHFLARKQLDAGVLS